MNADELRTMIERNRANFAPMRSVQIGFPQITLDPGEEQSVKVDVKGGYVFRAQKLMMLGVMDDIRGHFWLKHSRLPLLDRKRVVCAYSKVVARRYGKKKQIKFAKGKTVVHYADAERNFEREYLPSNVVYVPVDPLSYIHLRNFLVGDEPLMAGDGVPATFFGGSILGNGIPAPMTSASISVVLKNEGDIQVRVFASVIGYGRGPESESP